MLPIRILYVMGALVCLWSVVGSATALFAGILFSLLLGNPFAQRSGSWSKLGLKASVVGLGFGMGIATVLAEGRRSLLITLVGISLTILAGRLIGRLLRVEPNTSNLISFGTAICGGSAIAAMSPVIKARDEETAVALATVFTLNAAGLMIFPGLGHLLGLSQEAFGLWAALAIHDTSSVVGAAAAYGAGALALATTVKLTRALWITPVALGVSLFRKNPGKVTFPLFIVGFLLTALTRALVPQWETLWSHMAFGARRLLVLTLFLIGTGLTRDVLRKVGPRPMFQGLLLWGLVSIISLIVIRSLQI
jgi:uncharacterized integral membrane protein (TIGR00698 family)